ncbi:sensor histidine kinase [Methylotenera sp. L2L1]|uniref:sensor histidine kinase n=1 Tax=Methylotenera sp. L2L1 TaxID=1502770 RepID=UPI0005633AFE|nr:sensor histidine kinase [Methylotenera sp. L2L1]
MLSLKGRLSWSLTLSLVLLLSLQWLVVSYAINKLSEDQLTKRLQHEGESLLASAQFNASNQLEIDAQRLSAIYQRPFSGHYYVVSSGKQRLISRSLWDTDLNINKLATGEQKLLYQKGPEAQSLLIVINGYQKQGQTISIAMAENLGPLKASIERFQLIYAAISLLGLITLLAIQRLIIQHALLPLKKIQSDIAKLERGEANQIASKGPEEIAPLITELNHLLQTVQQKSKRSRESLGNLAHALKTKLTLLNQTAERAEIEGLPQIRESIYAATDALDQIIERELKRARLMGDVRPMQQIDLKTEIAQLTHTMRMIYKAKIVNITWEVTEGTKFHGDGEDLLEILGNLLDNACKWCKRNVSLTVTGSDAPIFVIEDDGPGCPVHELNSLTQRGFRADESVTGSGLGLAIVCDIANSYGANLSFSRSAALGGLRVEIRFTPRKLLA